MDIFKIWYDIYFFLAVERTLSIEEEPENGISGYRREKNSIIWCRRKPRGDGERWKDSGKGEI